MNGTAGEISAAAVIGLLVIVGGVAFLGRTPGGVGGSPPEPLPRSPSTDTDIERRRATPTTAPTPPALTTVRRALEPGTYVTGDPFRVRVTFTVPAGWEGHIGGPYLVDLGRVGGVPGGVFFAIFEKVRTCGPRKCGVAVSFAIFDQVSADPCHSDQGFRSATRTDGR